MARPKGKAGETALTIERVTAILTLMTKGARTADIIRFCRDSWKISDRQSATYIAKAKDHLRESARVDRDAQIGLALARYNDLFREMVRLQDYKGALHAQREICTLLGLSAPTKIDLDASQSFLAACAQADAWFKGNATELKAGLILSATTGSPAPREE